MRNFLIIAQIVIAVLLIISILSQEKGAGLSSAFGGSGQFFRGRRGVDKVLLWVSVVLAILFVAVALSFIFIQQPTSSNIDSVPVSDTAAPSDVPTP